MISSSFLYVLQDSAFCFCLIMLITSDWELSFVMPPSYVVLVPVTARSKAWVCSRSLAGIEGSYPAGQVDVCVLWCFWCCQVDVSGMNRSLAHRSRTECGMFNWVCEASTMRRPWPSRGCRDMGEILLLSFHLLKKLRMSGVVSQILHVLTWCTNGQLYISFSFIL